jgi:hypothetical protein
MALLMKKFTRIVLKTRINPKTMDHENKPMIWVSLSPNVSSSEALSVIALN